MGNKKKRFIPPIPPQLPVAIVDNHTHINYDNPTKDKGANSAPQKFDEQGNILPPVLEETLLAGMKQAGVRAAISSGCELPDLSGTLELARRYGNVWAALAIHPNEAAMHQQVLDTAPDGLTHALAPHHVQYSLDAAFAQVVELAQNEEVVAVGETGLDYFRTGEAGIAVQKKSFREHIALAKELNKPMQIHDRDAHADVVDILLRDGAPERTVFHCFSGDVRLAEICKENGWYASFSGTVTYPANKALRDAFLVLPEELILVETDAPYLTPVPFRGHPNVVWGVVYTAQFLAQTRNLELNSWCETLNSNTYQVYGI